MADNGARDISGRRGGYLTSAAAFAAITALWAVIVRDDPYYAMTQLLGLSLPIATVFYVTVMPLAGFIAGRWRYHIANEGGAPSWLAKLVARVVHFLYTHLLIALFTAAMITDYFFGWNIDASIKQLDNDMFEAASRFAPWLSAYLAGFNLGRAGSRE